MKTTTAADTLHITRRLKAPREKVFEAFSTGETMKKWFGPGPIHVKECAVDFRVGGRYRIKMHSPEKNEDFIVSGVYREIARPAKIVFTWKWEDDEDWTDCESVVSFEFKAVGDETELVLTQSGFPVPESRDRHQHGWNGCLEKLEALLLGRPAPEFKPSC